jgi:Xaa-Pro aminopeptidase
MKSDLDSLMEVHNFDALLITGSGQHNPAMVYMTGGAHLTNADLIKKRGEPPVLFYNPMERDEAAKSGLDTKDLAEYKYNELLKQCQGNQIKATAIRYQKMLSDLEINSGRLAIYGKAEAGTIYAILKELQESIPNITIIGEASDSMLLQAMATKEESEVDRIRQMGKITTSVVSEVADFLTSHDTENDLLITKDGKPLTIGEVKGRINLWLAERGAENPEGTIFAIGRDAGVPHSSGNPKDNIQLGQTIVFDIFPCEAGGGYHYDFTRTWCLGYAPDEALMLYQHVREVYEQIMRELQADTQCKAYQERACDLFEAKGHPTLKSNSQTQEGYVHGLGHGLGLHVHERPWFGVNATEADRLIPGVITTIEPGLYYPDRGMGVRLEDTVWVRPDKKIEILADYPLEFILPMRK